MENMNDLFHIYEKSVNKASDWHLSARDTEF